jgi:HEPN domain-containing protein
MIRYEEWINRAKSSFALSKAYTIAGTCYEDLCFQLQQAAEKALKGLLIYHGVEPEFTHNIEALLNELKKFTDIPKNINEAVKLTDYAVFTRYPGEYDEITNEEYEQAVKIAQDCLDWVEDTIKEIEVKKNI